MIVLQTVNNSKERFLVDSTPLPYLGPMSRLNKRALYQMASKNTTSFAAPLTSSDTSYNGGSVGELTLESVEIRPLPSGSQLPDGRLRAFPGASTVAHLDSDDAISVSTRAHRKGAAKKIDRREIRQKLGDGSLSHLTNAYVEQQFMSDEEMHSVQQRFYGLKAI